MTGVSDIRRTFLDYFRKNGHEVVRSASLVPANDPTLMFTAAGMVPFKNVFTGQETRPYSRATSSQKCLRAGGKHNDLENVGYTCRHHTFFEMLGNFSFGDYFKDDAIKFAWELVTKEFGIDKNRLTVTVYHTDDEAVKIWKKVAGLSDDKIIRIATSDNFWSAGDTGPCGPCTEIFYDHGAHLPGGPPGSPDEDGPRFVEIWNLVFMQYDQLASGERVNLPKPSIDTGSGLERMAAVLQGTHDNYATDLIRALIDASAHASNTDPDGDHRISHRVIADHIRASCFMMADGILPSNEGRGYVLRRIMRRAMRHVHLLDVQEPMMHRLVPALIAQMGETYPELKEAEALATETLRLEEARFKKTLDHGLTLLAAETTRLGKGEKLSGNVAFKLYDTYGFPLDLTQDVLRREQNREVDIAGFEDSMKKQRDMARAAWAGSGEAATDQIWFDIKEQHGATEFLGYKQEYGDGKVLAIANADGELLDSAVGGENVFIVTNQTPFYGESGGQAGDTGTMEGEHLLLQVTDTQKKLGALTVHKCIVKQGTIKRGDTVHMQIDSTRRDDIRANHSATHLLHAALRRTLGKHVSQKGSQVTADRLRFDISQPAGMTEEQITAVENIVNTQIRRNTEVTTRLMPVDEARAAGAIAMFGEKYDDEVRVLGMGEVGEDGVPFSLELCGGTHVRRTGDIGLLKIVSEGALAAGVRRIEAVTGRGALAYLSEQEQYLKDIAALLKTPPAKTAERVAGLMEDKKRLEKEISDLRRKMAADGGGEAKVINGVKFASRVLDGLPPGELRPLANELKEKIGSGIVALVSVGEDGKGSVVIAVTSDLTEKYSAVDLVRTAAAVLGGTGGGGRPDMAQAGGPEGKLAGDAVAAVETALAG